MLPASSRFRSVRAKFLNDANDKLNSAPLPRNHAVAAIKRRPPGADATPTLMLEDRPYPQQSDSSTLANSSLQRLDLDF
jgi:hypothetical protein